VEPVVRDATRHRDPGPGGARERAACRRQACRRPGTGRPGRGRAHGPRPGRSGAL